ncbi:MAG: nucleotidyltransferase domain-containing protein [Patescibacteria group bacterium]
MTQKDIRKIVSDYLTDIKKSGIKISEAYLFGSRVKGTEHAGSDIDLCIISEEFGKDRQKERVNLMNLQKSDNYIIEPHPFSPADFYRGVDLLAKEIQRTGIRLQM